MAGNLRFGRVRGGVKKREEEIRIDLSKEKKTIIPSGMYRLNHLGVINRDFTKKDFEVLHFLKEFLGEKETIYEGMASKKVIIENLEGVEPEIEDILEKVVEEGLVMEYNPLNGNESLFVITREGRKKAEELKPQYVALKEERKPIEKEAPAPQQTNEVMVKWDDLSDELKAKIQEELQSVKKADDDQEFEK